MGVALDEVKSSSQHAPSDRLGWCATSPPAGIHNPGTLPAAKRPMTFPRSLHCGFHSRDSRPAVHPAGIPTPWAGSPAHALPPAVPCLPGLLGAAVRRFLWQVPPPPHLACCLRVSPLRRLEPGHRTHSLSRLRLRPVPSFLLQELLPLCFMRPEAHPPPRGVPQ